ncbi:glycoside hydrolase superfamily [Cokeromyces recurvatus]|uniref:glycoside hydrolase superfamily n=1 Tax=Cokeromyces recurvatus TaxID=90255 RepID=UPI00221F4976|nr:glycoside hydrolase superfamily [Cokeromyces recurvatus]KAI7907571.1 glycoside hydrolase superfamily [Cokeromyces recurvatus]
MRNYQIYLTIAIAILGSLLVSVQAKKTHNEITCEDDSSSKNIYGKHKLITYIVDWDIPHNIKWDLFDHVSYAFAEPNKNGELKSFSGSNLKSVVREAHKNKVGVSISIGGWSGSRYFSSLVKSKSKRDKFAKNIMKLVEEYNLDGVNLDWEYPNDPNGVSCNEKDPNDTANFLTFIKLLREMLDKKYKKVHKLITAAVSTSPFNNGKQEPIKHLDKAWSANVDFFYIMVYDISGSWMKKAGPNSPLNKGGSYDSSVKQAVSVWKSAGIPANQIILGVPFYGHASRTATAITSSTGMYVKLARNSTIKGDKYDSLSADPCPGAVKSYSGSYEWRSIMSAGILDNKNGWKSYWDKRSATPYAYHSKDHKFLSYDNPKSLKDKMNYVIKEKLGGAMIWSLEMDDKKNTLLSSLQSIRD